MATSSQNQHAADIPLSDIRYKDGDSFMLSFKAIAVVVGPTENTHTFDVDQRLLTKHSQYFKHMLSGPWKEAHEKSVNFADGDADIFSIFALFIHSGKIFSSREGDVEVYPDGLRRDMEWARLARAWVLGDRLQATAFKDAVADAICDKTTLDQKWPITLHQTIYPNSTPEAKGIRRLCVDIAVAKWDARTLKHTLRDETWSEFFEDVAVRLMTMKEQEKAKEIDFEKAGCRYHEHVVEGAACWKSMGFLGSN